MPVKPLVLVVDDAADIRAALSHHLRALKVRIAEADTGAAALVAAAGEAPAVIMLDRVLPDIDGLALCARWKADPILRDVPIIMITTKGDDGDVIAGLDAGADDYVPKPFAPEVLLARVRAALRRRERALEGAADEPDDGTYVSGDLMIRPGRHEVRVAGELCPLTTGEFKLLWQLARRPGLVFTRKQLHEAIGGKPGAEGRSTDVQIVNLRRKLGPVGKRLETVRGVGYRLVENDTPTPPPA